MLVGYQQRSIESYCNVGRHNYRCFRRSSHLRRVYTAGPRNCIGNHFALIEAHLGTRCRYLCWPRGWFNEAAIRIAREEGYEACFSTLPGANGPGADAGALRRIDVKRGGARWLAARLFIYTRPALSAWYLRLRGNLHAASNEPADAYHDFAQSANVFDLLRELEAAGDRFDVIVFDPPAFAKNRASLKAAIRGYKEINLRAVKLLNAGGVLITCTCSYHISEELFLEILAQAAIDAHRRVQVMEKRMQATDHPVLVGVPETYYLKCFILRKMA